MSLADPILSDLEAGERPILLAELRDESFMPRRNGKKLDKSVAFRWAKAGKGGIRLETLRLPTGIATTRAACLRFFGKLTHPDAPAPARTRRQRAHAVDAARRELAAAGI